MNECIDAIEKANTYDVSGAEGNDNKIKRISRKVHQKYEYLEEFIN